MNSKKCSRCKVEKSLDDYHWKNQAKGIKQYQCKICHKETNSRHYQNNADPYLNRASNQRTQARDWLRDYKKTICCEVCGESHPATLDFHHKDSETKDREVSKMVGRSSIDAIKKEISKCMVLCANCHRKHHYEIQNRNVKPISVS